MKCNLITKEKKEIIIKMKSVKEQRKK